MRKHNGNKDYYPHIFWNEKEGGICGTFDGIYFSSKFYRYDGTFESYLKEDWRSKRGLLIRDHYSPTAIWKVHLITDNLCDYLDLEKIQYQRIDFDRETRTPIVD